jgi:hypothetical protein
MGGNEGAPDPQPWATINTSTNTIEWNGVTSFSDASALDGNEILPVSLLNFTAVHDGDKGVKLSWTTSMEENNDYFTIERSADGRHFNGILEVAGSGNYEGLKDYVVYDRAPLFGTSYYRLRQTDYDGTSETFHMIQVRNIFAHTLQVVPNPVTGDLVRVTGPGLINGRSIATVKNIAGNQMPVTQWVIGDQLVIQFPPGTPSGVYMGSVFTPGLHRKVVRIVKE